MKLPAFSLLGLCLAMPGAAVGNDTMAVLGTGGLMFVETGEVRMLSEELYVSTEEIRVTYEFRNESDADIRTLVAFPLPDITGSPDFMVALPTEDPLNIFGFETRFNGVPVEATLHQSAFAATNIDYSSYLIDLGVPLAPFGSETQAALAALGEQQLELFGRALVVPMEYDAGQGWQREFYPIWTLKSAYSWEALFPAGETVTVEHRYRPSVGGTVGVSFLAEPYEDYDPAADYRSRYCTDDSFIQAVERTLPDPQDRYGAPFTESWISYVWSTGGNWAGAIGRFHLTIDKGRPENLVSFCWDGKVTKTSPTTFEMEAENWFPPWNRELDILILNRQPQQ
jgi:hypothetical protein